MQHAFSLLQQHLRFNQLQKNDDFIRRYMNYLGHNEFGVNHKSWNKPINFYDFNKIDYWLEQWTLFYQNVFDKYKSNNNCFFVIYEELCNSDYLNTLLKKIKFKNTDSLNLEYFKNQKTKKIDLEFEVSKYNEARKIYNKFKKF